jgi:endoglucanase
VGKARGFSLNVSNFYSTSEEVTYGESVSQLLGGAHYVIDTSRNGRGPSQDEATNWCNPSGRSLGAVPTAVTGAEHADALLWIKRPGESDGECDRGDPNAGSWFNNYAVDIVKQSER